eukprot:TRINITY_DN71086_c0_g1_i1.p1 TRINITY_DN71086_c0_g1~~TRINITY_DN71086_c0_g1_i1.p1  ORF type:complete len:861 (+),score=68.61 TRINITY_DN71086_c0_g1_i1:87-2585(+)
MKTAGLIGHTRSLSVPRQLFAFCIFYRCTSRAPLISKPALESIQETNSRNASENIKRKLDGFLRKTQRTTISFGAVTTHTNFSNATTNASTQRRFPSVNKTNASKMYQTHANGLSGFLPSNKTTRFNEMKSTKKALIEYLDKARNPKKNAEVSEGLGIGLKPADKTVAMPQIVHARAEVNRDTYLCKNEWRFKAEPTPLDTKCPIQFPIRKNYNYLEVRKTLAKQRETSRGAVHRLCHDYEEELRMAAEEQKNKIKEQWEEDKERETRVKEWKKQAEMELLLANINDRDAKSKLVRQETIGTQCDSPTKVIKEITKEWSLLRAKKFLPYSLLPVENEFPEKPHTVFLRFNQREPPLEIDKGNKTARVKLDAFIGEVTTMDKTEEVKTYGTEFVLIEPRAYSFGDLQPHQITAEEYNQHFAYYKIDNRKLKDTLQMLKKEVKGEVEEEKEVTISNLRNALISIALPLETVEEKRRYSDMLQKAAKSRKSDTNFFVPPEQKIAPEERKAENKPTFFGGITKRQSNKGHYINPQTICKEILYEILTAVIPKEFLPAFKTNSSEQNAAGESSPANNTQEEQYDKVCADDVELGQSTKAAIQRQKSRGSTSSRGEKTKSSGNRISRGDSSNKNGKRVKLKTEQKRLYSPMTYSTTALALKPVLTPENVPPLPLSIIKTTENNFPKPDITSPTKSPTRSFAKSPTLLPAKPLEDSPKSYKQNVPRTVSNSTPVIVNPVPVTAQEQAPPPVESKSPTPVLPRIPLRSRRNATMRLASDLFAMDYVVPIEELQKRESPLPPQVEVTGVAIPDNVQTKVPPQRSRLASMRSPSLIPPVFLF